MDRFALHLGDLVPAIDPTDAYEQAAAVYADASDLDPREAAEIYSLELPPGEDFMPGATATS